jgi:hypothetical protein
MPLPVSMRTSPTVVATNTAGWTYNNCSYSSIANQGTSAVSIRVQSTASSGRLYATGTDNTTGWSASAEL